MSEEKTLEELRRLRHKKRKVTFTLDERGTTVEREILAIDAVPGWGMAEVPEGHSKEDMLARSLDIALGLLYHERAMTMADLANRVVEVWKVQANYTYGEFAEAARQDPRFQMPNAGIIALADEPDPLGVLADRIERDYARRQSRRRWDD